jgi:hypothetical protein
LVPVNFMTGLICYIDADNQLLQAVDEATETGTLKVEATNPVLNQLSGVFDEKSPWFTLPSSLVSRLLSLPRTNS